MPRKQTPNFKGLYFSLFALAVLIFAMFSIGSSLSNNTELANLSPEMRGQALFDRNCAACHGTMAEGRPGTPGIPALNQTGRAWTFTDGELQRLVLERGQSMPAYENMFTSDEVADIIRYMHTLWTDEQLADQQARSQSDPLR